MAPAEAAKRAKRAGSHHINSAAVPTRQQRGFLITHPACTGAACGSLRGGDAMSLALGGLCLCPGERIFGLCNLLLGPLQPPLGRQLSHPQAASCVTNRPPRLSGALTPSTHMWSTSPSRPKSSSMTQLILKLLPEKHLILDIDSCSHHQFPWSHHDADTKQHAE